MVENINTDENAENAKNSPKGPPSGLRWVSICGGIAWLVLPLVAVYHLGLTARVKFFSDSTLNLFIVIAVIAQVLIYRKQWDVMERQWRDDQRAYLAVESFEAPPNKRNPVLKIKNIGKLSADEVKVAIDLIILVPEALVRQYQGALKTSFMYHWWRDYGRTKLSRGGVDFEIPIPLDEEMTETELVQVSAGNARLIAQIKIEFNDSFTAQRFDYAFRFDGGKWTSWWAWTDDDAQKRIGEEQSRYHPK